VKAFEVARAHFANAELLPNEYSILTQASPKQGTRDLFTAFWSSPSVLGVTHSRLAPT
jgi:hypothetical protein